MDRRFFLHSASLLATAAFSQRALAHHGWSSFDEARPLYLAGRVKSVKWQNPHAEIVVTVSADAALPADLAKRNLPAQAAPVDGPRILAAASLPARRGDWTLELSPMTRVEAWKIAQPNVGDTIAAIGYTFKDEKGAAFARLEYLIVGERLYGLRSNPA